MFTSFIGYESLYAKDNFNYTRSWAADFTTSLMLGINASFPFTQKLTGSVFLVNGYWHLAHANGVPSFGGQIAHKPGGQVSRYTQIVAVENVSRRYRVDAHGGELHPESDDGASLQA